MPAQLTPEARRLLDLAADHMLAVGVGGLSLSQLARAIGSNNRMLLYYFGSKDALFNAALHTAYDRNPATRDLMAGLAEPGDLVEQLRASWRALRAPENLPYIRLFFNAFGTAVRDPAASATQLSDIAQEWPQGLTRALRAHGYDAGEAEAAAVRVLALWRGLQFALLEGVDPATLDDAHDRAVAALLAR